MALKRQRQGQKKRKNDILDLAAQHDEDVWSSDEEEQHQIVSSSSEEEEETLDAKRVRMARAYLDQLQQQQEDEEDSDDEEQEEDDKISMALQRQRLLKQGIPSEENVARLVQQHVSDMTSRCDDSASPEAQAKEWIKAGFVQLWRGHDLTPTCIDMPCHESQDQCVSGSKDHSVYLWDIERQHFNTCVVPKWNSSSETDRKDGQVTSIAFNGKHVAVGRQDATVRVYDVRSNQKVTTFAGHKGPVTAVRFGGNEELQLFSASTDRCIRHYNLQEMAYIETLYGHQSGVVDLDYGQNQKFPISVGRDRTARVWKLEEDAHLIFRGGGQLHAAERICCLDNRQWFVTGHEGNATLALWNLHKKKTIATVPNAHQDNNTNTTFCGTTALATRSDLVLSGSNDGYLRPWKVTTQGDSGEKLTAPMIESMGRIPVHGYINDLVVSFHGQFCIAAVGQEPRLGRWDRVPRAKNRICMIELQQSNTSLNGNAENSKEND